jgi:hypothetical protein
MTTRRKTKNKTNRMLQSNQAKGIILPLIWIILTITIVVLSGTSHFYFSDSVIQELIRSVIIIIVGLYCR